MRSNIDERFADVPPKTISVKSDSSASRVGAPLELLIVYGDLEK